MRVIWKLSVCAVLALLVGPLSSSPAQAEEERYQLGGGSSLLNQAEISVSQGQEIPQVHQLFVENLGRDTAVIEMEPGAPDGIKITTDVQTFELKPQESRTVRFGIAVSAGQPEGEFPISLSAKQTNVPPPKEGGFGFAPGVAVKFKVKVAPAAGNGSVSVKAVSEQSGQPVEGDMSLAFVPKDSPPFVVAAAKGSTLVAAVAPGPYQAKIKIEGLIEKSVDFTLKSGERKEIVIELEAVVFNAVGVKPSSDGGDIVTVDLLASVSNNLRPLEGPVTFNTIVRRDGVEVETVQLQGQPNLPTGLTDVRTSYRPANGWEPGAYTFQFNVKTPFFTVTASQEPTLDVPSKFPWLLVILALVAAAVVALIIRFLRRRRTVRTSSGGSSDVAAGGTED